MNIARSADQSCGVDIATVDVTCGTHNAGIDILASNGLMVKRPILVTEGKGLVGFKEQEWMNQFGK